MARAALDGRLDTGALRALPPEQARAALEQLSGIGPFSSAIVVVRSLGHTDYLAGPVTELNSAVGRLYGLAGPATPAELERISALRAPWRTWAQLHVRSVSPQLVDRSDALDPRGDAPAARDQADSPHAAARSDPSALGARP